ncbi:18.9 kDa heat shock protein-like [Typha latifolia]|uniref:18.9 kDa heat shock protein-like n=1 Tax=Typha latifolia TaxID=4733 RepID=UPI003C30467B
MSITSFFSRKSGGKTTSRVADGTINIDVLDPLETFALAALLPKSGPCTGASMDWKETPDAHVFIADLPGVKKNEVKIEVEEEKILRISGKRVKEEEDKGDKWHCVERSAAQFLRTVRLPANANVDGAKAAMEDGVLTVIVPKEQDKNAVARFIPLT